MRISDWSSDVCSSDLAGAGRGRAAAGRRPRLAAVWRAYALLGSVCFGAGADKINGFRAVTARATFLCFSRELFSTASGNTGGRRLEPPLRSSDAAAVCVRSEEHTSELPSLMRISYAVFCLKHNTQNSTNPS